MIKVKAGFCIWKITSMSGGELSMNETTKDTNLLITKRIIQGRQLAVGSWQSLAAVYFTIKRLND
jgi:hypothetical protein